MFAVAVTVIWTGTLRVDAVPTESSSHIIELTIEISQRGATATATITVQYSEYGEPTAISIPPEVYDDTYELGCPGAS